MRPFSSVNTGARPQRCQSTRGLAPTFLTGSTAAGGIAFACAIGDVGGFACACFIGWLRDTHHVISAGPHGFVACMPIPRVLAYPAKLLNR
ncbi:hypothetical protein [Burkholderia territorii]|uniref:hypothetical protein n=1 Tax=Burkholderia territorii TaxID=1503055 RepID=UPI0012D96AAC|nr:hypothetical protein [Burkholderia territorii]